MTGLICWECGQDNGITQYIGKTCKKCGLVLFPKMECEQKQ